jgi:hypothetical protein
MTGSFAKVNKEKRPGVELDPPKAQQEGENNFYINFHLGYVVKIKFCIFSNVKSSLAIFYYRLSLIQIVSYRLLLYSPAYENAFINIFIIIRLFTVIRYKFKNTLTSM